MVVLIVGAGPVGLCLALTLLQNGVPPSRIRIVSKIEEPYYLRALILWPRTLELMTLLGTVDDLYAKGEIMDFNLDDKTSGEGGPSLDMSILQTPHPFMLTIPQIEQTTVLHSHLTKLGLQVEYGVAFEGFVCDAVDKVTRGLRVGLRDLKTNERSVITVDYVVGADGAHSSIRKSLGIGFPGEADPRSMWLLDIEFEECPYPKTTGSAGLSPDGVYIRIPCNKNARVWCFAIPAPSEKEEPTLESYQAEVERFFGTPWPRVTKVLRLCSHRSHHRVASRYTGKDLRVFLAGDSGHIHSPLGGQGVNLGYGDAINLGWKLAAAELGHPRATELLQTYEDERHPIGEWLIRLIQRVTNRRAWLSRFDVLRGVQMLATFFGSFSFSRRRVALVVSQLSHDYVGKKSLVVAAPRRSQCGVFCTSDMKAVAGGRLPHLKVHTANEDKLVSIYRMLPQGRWLLLYLGLQGQAAADQMIFSELEKALKTKWPGALPFDLRRCSNSTLDESAECWSLSSPDSRKLLFPPTRRDSNIILLIRPDAYIALVDSPMTSPYRLLEFMTPIFPTTAREPHC